jgi:hypothetical protein
VNLQITNIVARNLSANANTPTLFVQVVNDGILELTSANGANLFTTILEPDQVAQVRKTAPYELLGAQMLGGNIFGKIWNGIKDAGKWAWNHKGDIANVAKAAAPLVGLGQRHHKKHHALGSALITKKKLHRRMRGHGLESESESESDYE